MRWWQNQGLNFKVALGITITMVIVLGIVFVITSQLIRAQLWQSEIQKTEDINAIAETLLDDAMLTGRKSTIDAALAKLGQKVGNQQLGSITVYDDQYVLTSFASGFPGSPTFHKESMPSSIEDPSCWGCHQLPPEERPSHLVVLVEGREVIRNSVPLYNEERCQTCHGTGKQVLGDIMVDYSQDQFKQAYNTISLGLGIGFILTIGLVALVLYQVLRRIVLNPVGEFVEMADSISRGALERKIEVQSGDEIGILARAFNSMASQLREMIGGLEQRVAERTKALATSAEVTRRLATVLDLHQLVNEVVQQVRDAFEYYYAQIYLLDEAGENLVIAGGTGDAGASMVGRKHSVPVGRGLVGRAAENNESVLVPDTSQDSDWLPNELLPETRAEAAIPISIGDQVMGVLDVQHNLINGLTHEDVILLESLAGQVAISLQNARSYEQSRKRAELESLMNVIGQKIQRTTSVEDTLQTAIRELGTAIGASRVKASLRSTSSAIATDPVALAESPLAVVEGEEGAFDSEGTLAD